MDPQLAQIYGTNTEEAPEDDLEKSAAAELLVKLAEEEDVDLDQFSDDDIRDMVNDIYTGDAGGDDTVKVAQADDGSLVYVNDNMEILGAVEDENLEKAAEALGLELVQDEDTEAKEKVAEADTLGRVMAHSMVQELNEIEKDAAGKVEAVKSGLMAAGRAVKGAPAKYGKSIKERGQSAAAHLRQAKAGYSTGGQPLTGKQRVMDVLKAGKKVGPEAALGAAGLAGTAGAAHALSKKGSALEKLAEERAWQIASEAGYVDQEGNLLVPQQEKVAEASELDVAVETAALQMLEQAGIPVEWNK